MGYSVPRTPMTLMTAVYRYIFPAVRHELTHWQTRAEQIPDNELRDQALASMGSKRFHCMGGAVYALLAGYRWHEAVRFIVAYQTISDYLDNLCDRSTSMDPDDFRQLHQAMTDALTQDNPIKNYYAFHDEQDDGEYLADLVRECQKTMRNMANYGIIQEHLSELEHLYSDLQVHKHVRMDERISRLTAWFHNHEGPSYSLYWHEFAAAAGSTLGVFCLVSYTMCGRMNENMATRIMESYFPYMQGLHILLDYYIDQKEDTLEGDLNFCRYYESVDQMKERFCYFIRQADRYVQQLMDRPFHKMVYQGLIGLYLGDPKVNNLNNGRDMKTLLFRESGHSSSFFHWNAKAYHWFCKTKARFPVGQKAANRKSSREN
ncbi:tetraprenyl-beta-curcumene synthase [Lentibacillus halophilus]|uniref:Tetraprenyl-beta-curcumene synthase n=1 Tax=Lentibacillus halophilus TaxID=295065 RepID=A0ABP3J123_9BACI